MLFFILEDLGILGFELGGDFWDGGLGLELEYNIRGGLFMSGFEGCLGRKKVDRKIEGV